MHLSDLQRDISAVRAWTAPRNLLNVTFSRVTDGFEVGWFYFCVSALKSALVASSVVYMHTETYALFFLIRTLYMITAMN